MGDRRGIRTTLLCAGALLALSAPLSAQTRIRVTSADGEPMPAVRVEVYGTAERIRTVTTEADGTVDLGAERWDEVRRISLSHIGFQTLLVQRDDLAARTELRLEPAAMAIEGLSVGVEGQLCPLTDVPEARALWAEVAARYSPDTGLRPLFAEFAFAEGQVMEEYVHETIAPGGRIQGTRSAIAGSGAGRARAPLERMIARDGYSWTMPQRTWSARNLNHFYPSLEMWDAYHFATPTFAERHDFEIVSEHRGVVRLAFCPRERAVGTTVSGVIDLVPGDRFVEARFEFDTSGPDENAGGAVTFVAHREGARRLPHLLAARGVFFRHSGHDSPFPKLSRAYYRQAFADVEWHVLPPRVAGN